MAIGPMVFAADVAGSTSSASATNSVIGKPSGVVDGDYLFAFLLNSAGVGFTPPSDSPNAWTSEYVETSFFAAAIFYKRIPTASAETQTSYTFVCTGGAGVMKATICRIPGVHPTSPIDALGTIATSSGTSLVENAVTAVGSAAYQIAMNWLAQTTGSVLTFASGVPSGWTQDYEASSPTTSTYFDMEIAHKQLSASGSTGTPTFTMSGTPSNGARGISLTLNPAPVVGGPIAVYNRAALIRASSF